MLAIPMMPLQIKIKKALLEIFQPVLRIQIRIRRIRIFLGLLDPDPFVRGVDPDPSIIKQQ
jgi:hypothetical protein